MSYPHRIPGYSHLNGKGLEIGALHEPTPLPPGVSVSYFDAIPRERAIELFREIPPEKFVNVDFIGDLDNHGLSQFEAEKFDFVLIMHVLEHVSNPIGTVLDVFRIIKRGGLAVIAVPDKNYTYDHSRALTPFDHLWQDYVNDVRFSDDEHYKDFLRAVAPTCLMGSDELTKKNVETVRERREHVHVWDSTTFKSFLEQSLTALKIKATRIFESVGKDNQIEYISIWRKE